MVRGFVWSLFLGRLRRFSGAVSNSWGLITRFFARNKHRFVGFFKKISQLPKYFYKGILRLFKVIKIIASFIGVKSLVALFGLYSAIWYGAYDVHYTEVSKFEKNYENIRTILQSSVEIGMKSETIMDVPKIQNTQIIVEPKFSSIKSIIDTLKGKRKRYEPLRAAKVINSLRDKLGFAEINDLNLSHFIGTLDDNFYWKDSCFENVDLSYSWFKSANFRGSNFRKTIFRGSNLAGANFDSVILDSTVFEFANLSGANFDKFFSSDPEFFKKGINRELYYSQKIYSIVGANIYGIQAPKDFQRWAIAQGAVELDPIAWAKLQMTLEDHYPFLEEVDSADPLDPIASVNIEALREQLTPQP